MTKTDLFTDKQTDLATLVSASVDPAKAAFIDYLIKVDTCICGIIAYERTHTRLKVSQHLIELKNAGLINVNIEGNSIFYCGEEKGFSFLQDYFIGITDKMKLKYCNYC